MLKVAIIILHFGDPNITIECLDSLGEINQKNIEVKIYVLDNQGTIKRHSNCTKITFLPFNKNLGFAGGNNEVVRLLAKDKNDYYLFLNNDTKVYPDFLVRLIKEMGRNNNIGISGPVIEHKVNHGTYYDYGGNIDWFKGQPKHINRELYESSDTFIIRDFVSGCCLCIKAQLFHQLKGFNESYFMYLEDVDLCVRAKKLGFQTVCIPSSKILHLGSKSVSENFKIKQSLWNGVKFTLAHVPVIYKMPALLFNVLFYPSLWLRWKVKRLLKDIKKAAFF